jgi:hypothetical protein
MSTPYDSTQVPVAPILSVRLSAPRETAHHQAVAALIDTGADFTLVPLRWLLAIDAPESRYAYIRGLWSEPTLVPLYLVDIHLEAGVLPGVEVAGVADGNGEEQETIIGRNVLNQLILLLDGPHAQMDVLERRPLRF